MNTRADRRNLLAILDAVLAAGGGAGVALADASLPPPPGACCQPWCRLSVLVSGRLRTLLAQSGRQATLEERPGCAVFYPPLAWNLRIMPATFHQFGIVFRDGYLRFVSSSKAFRSGRLRQSGARYHTARPLPAQGRHVLQALQQAADTPGDPATARLLFLALLRICRAELAAPAAPLRVNRALRSFRLACDYLQDHFPEPVNRDSVARSLGLHPNYLSRLFRAHGGESFVRHLRGLRLRRAAVLLADPRLTVEAAARHAGFGDLAHFFRTFRNAYDMSPTRYRLARSAGRPTARRAP